MSHELEQRNGTTSFAFNALNGDPWHRLGTPVNGNMTIDEALVAAKANFTVEKRPLTATVPGITIDDSGVTNTEVHVPVEGKIATVRDIPGETNENGEQAYQVLGVLGEGYHVIQNREALQYAYDIVGASDGAAHLDTLGVLEGGAKLFTYVDLGELVIDPTGINDRIKRGLFGLWSHNGSVAMTYGFADTRVVCSNTVQMALNEADRLFKAKHTSRVEDRMKLAQGILGVSTDWAKSFENQAMELLKVPYTEDRFQRVLQRVFPVPGSATDRQKRNTEAVHTQVRGIFTNERNSKEFGANGWTMYNAIVEYLDHGREAEEADRLRATMEPGSWVEKRKVHAHESILALA